MIFKMTPAFMPGNLKLQISVLFSQNDLNIVDKNNNGRVFKISLN